MRGSERWTWLRAALLSLSLAGALAGCTGPGLEPPARDSRDGTADAGFGNGTAGTGGAGTSASGASGIGGAAGTGGLSVDAGAADDAGTLDDDAGATH